jgi:hypothetical protein
VCNVFEIQHTAPPMVSRSTRSTLGGYAVFSTVAVLSRSIDQCQDDTIRAARPCLMVSFGFCPTPEPPRSVRSIAVAVDFG